MAESCFSSNESKSFIQISNDNRVSLWDTDTRKEKRTYVEKQHLSHSYTCSSWISGKKDNLGYFAVGTSDGTIVIWDLTRGVISKVLGRANESPVPTSIAFSNDSKFLLVSSSENHIVQYDLSTGKEVRSFKVGKRGVLRIVINPKVEVIAAGG
jgi:WD40 repeat protein